MRGSTLQNIAIEIGNSKALASAKNINLVIFVRLSIS